MTIMMMVMMIIDHSDDNDKEEADDDDEDVDSVHGDLIQRAGQSKKGCERVPPTNEQLMAVQYLVKIYKHIQTPFDYYVIHPAHIILVMRRTYHREEVLEAEEGAHVPEGECRLPED